MKSRPAGSATARNEVGGEDDRPLQHADEERVPARVVAPIAGQLARRGRRSRPADEHAPTRGRRRLARARSHHGALMPYIRGDEGGQRALDARTPVGRWRGPAPSARPRGSPEAHLEAHLSRRRPSTVVTKASKPAVRRCCRTPSACWRFLKAPTCTAQSLRSGASARPPRRRRGRAGVAGSASPRRAWRRRSDRWPVPRVRSTRPRLRGRPLRRQPTVVEAARADRRGERLVERELLRRLARGRSTSPRREGRRFFGARPSGTGRPRHPADGRTQAVPSPRPA